MELKLSCTGLQSPNYRLPDTNQNKDAALASPGNVLSPVLVWMDCRKYHTGHTGIPEDGFSSCNRLTLA